MILDQSKLLLCAAMVVMNAGSSTLFSGVQKYSVLLQSPLVKQLTLFCILFVATRDFVISAATSFVIFILASTFFNPNSPLFVNLVPASHAQYVRRDPASIAHLTPGIRNAMRPLASPLSRRRKPRAGAGASSSSHRERIEIKKYINKI
jgi:hypothetical protein